MHAELTPADPAARVMVGLSGGVDSAVAALLLKDAGWNVQGLFLSNWEEEDDDAYCTAAQDFQDARAVAAELGIVLHRVSFAAEYRERVFAHFLREHCAGRTPNPDVLCNREIKFGVALQWARRLGASHFATGHYARLETGADGPALCKARDALKDQSYFLHAVPRHELAATLMPLGELHKSAVRERARRAGLPVFDKPDSTGICFIGERPFREFLNRYLPKVPGPIVDENGRTIGQHIGLAFYTIGQRKGIGIGGMAKMKGEAWYVADKRLGSNELIVVQGHDHPLLLKNQLKAQDAAWVSGQAPGERILSAKTRYRQADAACRLERVLESEIRVKFDAPQWAVTPGQSVVLYEREVCLGGGVIT